MGPGSRCQQPGSGVALGTLSHIVDATGVRSLRPERRERDTWVSLYLQGPSSVTGTHGHFQIPTEGQGSGGPSLPPSLPPPAVSFCPGCLQKLGSCPHFLFSLFLLLSYFLPKLPFSLVPRESAGLWQLLLSCFEMYLFIQLDREQLEATTACGAGSWGFMPAASVQRHVTLLLKPPHVPGPRPGARPPLVPGVSGFPASQVLSSPWAHSLATARDRVLLPCRASALSPYLTVPQPHWLQTPGSAVLEGNVVPPESGLPQLLLRS